MYTPTTTGELLDIFKDILKDYKLAMWVPSRLLPRYCKSAKLDRGICNKSMSSYHLNLSPLFDTIYAKDIDWDWGYICPPPTFKPRERTKKECFLPSIAFLKREIARLSQLPDDASLEFYSEPRDSMK